jgi:uncharacterized membrane protein
VRLSVAGLPTAVAFVQEPIPPVSLAYGEPQTVNVNVYVLPGAAAGNYEFTVSATNSSRVALTPYDACHLDHHKRSRRSLEIAVKLSEANKQGWQLWPTRNTLYPKLDKRKPQVGK